MLNITRLVKSGGNQLVERHGLMFVKKPSDRLARRKLARIPYLDTIGEYPHFY